MKLPVKQPSQSVMRAQARWDKDQIKRQACKEAEAVYPGVDKNHKKYAEKLEFIENRIVKYSSPKEAEIVKARKALNLHLQEASKRGRAGV